MEQMFKILSKFIDILDFFISMKSCFSDVKAFWTLLF